MGFASAYLEKRAIFPEFIKEAPHQDTGIIVVVPAYNEPAITELIDSLASCYEPECSVEVIIVINAPADAVEQDLLNNKRTIENLRNWEGMHSAFFRIYLLDITPFRKESWGVGSARKTGMDEAVRRFEFLARPDGVILNLDADCAVAKNYFTAISAELLNRRERSACSIYFEHPCSGDDFPGSVYRSIILYELHLRYYFQGLKFAGFPYVHHTVGSAIAVKAGSYVKAGGMNRRVAGEDFYFIQKLVPAGGYFNLNRTTVYPSPRPSSRVPFGTGAIIARMSDTGNEQLLTYNFTAFEELKSLFGSIDEIFLCSDGMMDVFYKSLPEGIRRFTDKTEWIDRIREIKGNTKGFYSFRKRFFNWFNMFRIVKYLNAVHRSYFTKKPVEESALMLLKASASGLEISDPAVLLRYYRELEKSD